MVIIRDNTGKVIGTEASARYVSTRTLRNRHEQALCDKACNITRDETPTPEAIHEHEFESRFIAHINHAQS